MSTRKPTSYPGRVLARELKVRDLSQSELARRMGRPVQLINAIVNNRRAITPETAVDLARVLKGIPPRFWLTLQMNYDLRRLGVAS